jgi:very-short-patch-repair endonuclease
MATRTKQKQGCLSIIFPFLGRKSTKTIFKASDYNSPNDSISAVEPIVPEILPYRVRDDFLSPAEFSFYKILSSLGGTRLTVQSKVRLADVFFVSRPNENMTYFSRIAQKHLDFLVCDSITMKPLLGIELDDSSHKRDDRQERDDFVERVFQAAGLPLLRLPVQREYNTKEVAAKIAPLLKDKISSSAAPSQSETVKQESSTPICPKCGIPMVLRTVSQGEHKGKQFYGCRNYPRCREMKPFTA